MTNFIRTLMRNVFVNVFKSDAVFWWAAIFRTLRLSLSLFLSLSCLVLSCLFFSCLVSLSLSLFLCLSLFLSVSVSVVFVCVAAR